MTTKRCTKCQLVKSISEFSKDKHRLDGFRAACRVCDQINAGQLTERGLKVLKSLAENSGCCQHCLWPYTEQDWHFFEFDHIDAKLKLHKSETDSRWIAGHTDEFITRVVPNIQLLCVKCHKIKSSEEKKLGGAVYQKTHSQSKPAEVVELGWSLFSQPPTLEPDDSYTYHAKEGEWLTVRDVNGNLISYQPYKNFIKTK